MTTSEHRPASPAPCHPLATNTGLSLDKSELVEYSLTEMLGDVSEERRKPFRDIRFSLIAEKFPEVTEPSPEDDPESFEHIRHYFMSAAFSVVTEPPPNEQMSDLMQRIAVPGQIHTITSEVYSHFQLTLPIKAKHDKVFTYHLSDGSVLLLWRAGFRHLCRTLTEEESEYVSRAMNNSSS